MSRFLLFALLCGFVIADLQPLYAQEEKTVWVQITDGRGRPLPNIAISSNEWGKPVITTSSGKAGVPVAFKVRVGDLVYVVVKSRQYTTATGGPVAIRVSGFNKPYEFSPITLVPKLSLALRSEAANRRVPQSGNDPFQKGQRAFASQRFQEAARYFLESRDVRKDNYNRHPKKISAMQYADAASELGVTYMILNRWSESFESLEEAIRVNPTEERRYLFGIVAMTMGDFPRAEKTFREMASSRSLLYLRPIGAMFESQIHRIFGQLSESSRFEQDFAKQLSRYQWSPNRDIDELTKVINAITTDVENNHSLRDAVRLIAAQSLTILLKANIATIEKRKGAYSSAMIQPLHDLASVLQKRERYEEAAQLLDRLMSIEERLFGRDHVWTAMFLDRLGDFEKDRELYDKAEDHYREAMKIFERSLGKNTPWIDMIEAELATLYQEQNRFPEAEAKWKGMRDRHCSNDLNNMACLEVLVKLSEFYSHQNKNAEAVGAQRQAIDVAKKLWAAKDPIGTRIILEFIDDLEDLYERSNQKDQIAALQREKQEILDLGVVPVAEETYEATPMTVRITGVRLNGSRCQFTSPNSFVNYPKAKKLLEAAQKATKYIDNRDPDVAELAFALASVYYSEDRLDQAMLLVNQAINSNELALRPNRRTTAVLLSLRAGIAAKRGDLFNAEKDYKDGGNIVEVLDKESEDIPIFLYSLGKVQIEQHKYSDAERNLRRALNMREDGVNRIPCSEPDSVAILTELAVLYTQLKRYSEAEAGFKQALTAIREDSLASYSHSFYILQNYARLLRELGRLEEAVKIEEKAQKINTRN